MNTVPDSQTHAASILKVLANPTRLDVVRQLLHGPRHVGELNQRLGLEQSLFSHHLRVLREAGLVVADRDGKAMLYRLGPALEPDGDGAKLSLGACRLSFPLEIEER